VAVIAGKVWGTTEQVLSTPLIDMHRLYIKAGTCCSWHKHERKWNGFTVIHGKLVIEVRKNDYAFVDVTVLGPGVVTSVPPGEFHRFVAGVDCLALEFYYLDILGNDIIRDGVGGLLDGDQQLP
jgi:mannose-6-phosphate isomerase-like protein (cupin superfamily)